MCPFSREHHNQTPRLTHSDLNSLCRMEFAFSPPPVSKSQAATPGTSSEDVYPTPSPARKDAARTLAALVGQGGSLKRGREVSEYRGRLGPIQSCMPPTALPPVPRRPLNVIVTRQGTRWVDGRAWVQAASRCLLDAAAAAAAAATSTPGAGSPGTRHCTAFGLLRVVCGSRLQETQGSTRGIAGVRRPAATGRSHGIYVWPCHLTNR